MSSVKVKMRKNKVNAEGRAPLVLQVIVDRKSKEISLGKYIEPKHWDGEKNKVKSSYTDRAFLQAFLDREQRQLETIIDRKRALGERIELSQVVNEYKGNTEQINRKANLVQFLENYIQTNPDQLAEFTLKNYSNLVTQLKAFKPNARIMDVGVQFLRDFEIHLRDVAKNKQNTIHTRLKVLRKIIRYLIREGVRIDNPFEKYSLKLEQTQRDYLTEEELRIFKEVKTNTGLEKLVKDTFLFACYTGLRFSDICLLKKEAVRESSTGAVLSIRMKKTKDPIIIPLPKPAVSIIGQYAAVSSDHVLPIIEGVNLPTDRAISSRNAYYNKVLGKLGERAEIEKSLSMHVGRHTFATVGLSLGIPIEVVSKLLGHKNLATTQIYAKIVDQMKVDAMSKFDNL